MVRMVAVLCCSIAAATRARRRREGFFCIGKDQRRCCGRSCSDATVFVIIDSGGATLDALREVVMTLEDTEQTARRVLGGAHPLTVTIEASLRDARAALRATP